MTKEHLKYLLIGILFWGVLIGITTKFIFYKDISLFKLFLVYIAATLFLTFLEQWNMGGFIATKNPKRWFYLPLICWLIALTWGNVEIFMSGGEPFFIDFLR